jgi:hypothetical protein
MNIIQTPQGTFAVEELGELIEFATLEAATEYANMRVMDLNNVILTNLGA